MGGGGGLLQESWLPNTQAASYTNTISEYFTIGARLSSTLYHGHDTASKVGIKDIATLCLWEKTLTPIRGEHRVVKGANIWTHTGLKC